MKNTNSFGVTLVAVFMLLALSVFSAAHAGSDLKKFVVTVDMESGEKITASQLSAADGSNGDSVEMQYGVSILEEFRSEDVWFQAFSAGKISDVEDYMNALEVKPSSIIESAFIHTPESVGGPKAGKLRDGHNIYMIEREIPGAGNLPQETRDEIALGSQGTIDKIGDGIEWDHSYVTLEGTYCIYRANDPSLIEKHAAMFNVPANVITQVEHIVHDVDNSKSM